MLIFTGIFIEINEHLRKLSRIIYERNLEPFFFIYRNDFVVYLIINLTLQRLLR